MSGAPIWGMTVNGAELRVEQLVAGYGSTTVIDAVSVSLAAGERLAVLGRNGVGKTTLLASLMGLTDRFEGRIALDQTDISKLSAYDRAGLGIGLVPQTRDIFQSLNVEENLITGLKKRPRICLHEAYQLFPRLAERRANAAAMLSGGEQQMLSIARTLLGQPRLLLLDEPLEGLAPILCDEVMEAVSALVQDRQITVILVEQRSKRALNFADRVIFLERGRVAFSGAASEARSSSALVERYVGMVLRDATQAREGSPE
jgi:branched-chain amino acid transport system ATP-binding protein